MPLTTAAVFTCEICDEGHQKEECNLANPVARISDTPFPVKAIFTLPTELRIATKIDASGRDKFRVLAATPLRKGTQFGPLDAPESDDYIADCAYQLMILRERGTRRFLDTTDEQRCNWMVLVDFSSEPSKVNCLCFQSGERIYFTTIKDVFTDEELVVGYAPGYGGRLKVDLMKAFAAQPTAVPLRPIPPLRTYKSASKARAQEEKQRADHDYFCENAVDTSINVMLEEPMATTGCQEVVVDYLDRPEDLPVRNSSVSCLEEQPVESNENYQAICDPSASLSADSIPEENNDDIEDQIRLMVQESDMEFKRQLQKRERGLSSINRFLEAKNVKKYPVLAKDEWICKFCSERTINVSDFAIHLIEHYKRVGAARTEKARLQKRCIEPSPFFDDQLEDTNGSNEAGLNTAFGDTRVSHSAVQSDQALNSADADLQALPKYPYICDICVHKKIYNRAEYVARHLKCHVEDSATSSDDGMFDSDELTMKNTYPCSDCPTSFDTEKMFHLHVQKVHFRPLICVICDKPFKTHEAYITHKCRDNENNEVVPAKSTPYVCALCEKNLKNSKDLQVHVKRHGEDFSCSTCGKILHNHHFKAHLGICKAVSEFASGNTEHLQCPTCAEIFISIETFRKHVIVHTHPGMCPSCQQRIPVSASLKTHKCGQFTCDGCDQALPSFRAYENHLDMEHGCVDYYCFDCALPFVTKEAFVNHKGCSPPKIVIDFPADRKKRVRKKEGVYVCELCGAVYEKWSSLKTHRSIHGPKKYQCNTCGKMFHRKGILACHEAVHRAPQLECDVCGKKLKSKKSLGVHKRIHSGVKQFQCTDCDKAFYQKINLDNHKLTHLPLDQKGIECPHCDKKFSTREYLRFHIQEHLSGKNHVCLVCGKRFVKKHILNQHIKSIHSNTKYYCEFCNTILRQKQTLQRHLQKRHNDVMDRWNQPGYLESRGHRVIPDTSDLRAEPSVSFIEVNKDYKPESEQPVVYAADIEMVDEISSLLMGQNDTNIDNSKLMEDGITLSGDNIIIPEHSNMVILQMEEGGDIVLALASDLKCNEAGMVEGLLLDGVNTMQL